MPILADDLLSSAQCFATGRLFERFTQRGFDDYEITLGLSHPGGGGRVPARLRRKPAGYFALGISPGRDMPRLPDSGEIEITLSVAIPGRVPFDRRRTVPAAHLALVERAIVLHGRTLRMALVSGAPFDFSIGLAPAPVALAGILIEGNDPAEPVTDGEVSAPPAPAVSTDSGGRFFIPALPVLESVTLEISRGGEVIETVPHRPDFTKRVNTITLSV